MWKIPDTTNETTTTNETDSRPHIVIDLHLKLRSHRSIVNQCRFNYNHCIMASSGIEKLIKIWSPVSMPGAGGGGLLGTECEYTPKRRLYRYPDLLEYRRQADQALVNQELVPYETSRRTRENVEEDKMMLAFFDFQIQRKHRDCEAFFVDFYGSYVVGASSTTSSGSSSSESESQDSDNDDDDDDDETSSSSSSSLATRSSNIPRRSRETDEEENSDETSTNTSFSDRNENR